jgi:toxin HigB-1
MYASGVRILYPVQKLSSLFSYSVAGTCTKSFGFGPLRVDLTEYLSYSVATRYTPHTTTMIKSFLHKGLEKFFKSGSKAGVRPDHAKRLSRLLVRLNVAESEKDMALPGWDMHPLEPPLEGHFAVSVNGNWRLTFTFEGKDAILVDYQDYH